MMDIDSFLNRTNKRKADLLRDLGMNPKSSLISAYISGASNPSYDVMLKLIELGITAQELFGEEIGSKLVQNSAPSIPPELSNDPDFQKGLQQAIDAKVSATVKTELEKILKQKGLL